MAYQIKNFYELGDGKSLELLQNIVRAGVALSEKEAYGFALDEETLTRPFCKGFLSCTLNQEFKSRALNVSGSVAKAQSEERRGYAVAESLALKGRIRDIFPEAVAAIKHSNRAAPAIRSLRVVEALASEF